MAAELRYGHMVHEYTVARARAIREERMAFRAGVRTKAQVLTLQENVRRTLRRVFGPVPGKTPLNARIMGTVDRKAYAVEKILFESRPGLPVTANLYLPKTGHAPRPAVLGLCGHSAHGKAEDAYQAYAQNLAAQGFVVFIIDPLSQGERLQYLDTPEAIRPFGCCQEHNMMGNQMNLTGQFFGAWRVWDAIRGLDYLLSRPEVDATRVGVTGNSGGGTLTSYVTALDPRPTMAAPSCFVNTYLRNLENELPADSEQIPPGILASGLDMADFFVAHMPRPTLLLGQINDFFDVRGIEETYEELRRLYGILGAEEQVQLFVGPTVHGYSQHNREAMYGFFQRHAGVQARKSELPLLKPEKAETLSVTASGQVHELRMKRVHDFTRDTADTLAERRKPLDETKLRLRLSALLSLPKRSAPPPYRKLRVSQSSTHKGAYASPFAVETEPGILAILTAHTPKEYQAYFPSLKSATLYVPHRFFKEDAEKGQSLKPPFFSVDVRGNGETTPRTCNDEDFFAPYGADYFYAAYGQMMNEPYSGRRAHDLLCVLDLFAAHGCESVHLIGRGLGAVTATFAACLHPIVKQVTLHNALLSYHELTQTPVYRWPLSSMAFGVLKELDLPDCYRLLGKRLTLHAPWNAMMQPWRKDALKKHVKALGLEGIRIR